MAMLGSALVFGLTTLSFLTGLTCLISALLVPADVGPERRFEKRLEYSIFAVAGLVCFTVLQIFG
ncbi:MULTISPECIES: hypothetical protein [unclassified Arsukibacterium]|uniref:hypothetical protein n=1 Tax=unclassified Arsukibacterium TaxID=2635278 RepID=UPI000C8A5AA8|nr:MULTISPECIES: hypothetical protein [unclassified Arsukibacterium]MAA95685.1 hypothetical protein [Rheinheimera sp.]HAW92661.1 hypothetical protein [Candidatus Azambacteria bacterium]|tara:strand:- start:595 stop:789 length:195 start_codon:yes stop_codon:yes gene_type:complete